MVKHPRASNNGEPCLKRQREGEVTGTKKERAENVGKGQPRRVPSMD